MTDVMNQADEHMQAWETAPEVDELAVEGMPLPVEYELQECIVSDETLAEDALRHLDYWEGQLAAKQAHYDRERARIDRWFDRQKEKIGKRMEWHSHGLEVFMRTRKLKTCTLAHGTLRYRDGRPSITVDDEETFLMWAIQQETPDGDLYQEKRVPDKKKILAYIKTCGEIPPGCDHIIGPGRVTITTG